MHLEWAHYKRGDRKVLKTEDGYLYTKGAKGRPGSNTQYMRCACSKCPGTGKLKTDIDNSFEILRQHNHDSRLYGFETKALEIVLRKEAAKKESSRSSLRLMQTYTSFWCNNIRPVYTLQHISDAQYS